MRRKQVNKDYVPTHGLLSPINRRPSITDSLKEITQFLAADQQLGKSAVTESKASLNNLSIQKEQVELVNNLDQHKQGVAANAEKQDDTKRILKEMLDWKHKYHALENEKQKHAIQNEENLKRLQENFRLELAAAIEAHVVKIEEISDEMQRLVSENEAFRKQLALNNIEPVTTLVETALDDNCRNNTDVIAFVKEAHQSALSSVNDTADLSETLKSSIESTVQAIDFELNLLKVGHLVPKEELLSLAREHHERSAGQVAKDTLLKALPNLFARGKSDRRKNKALSRTDSMDSASIRSCETTSSRGTVDNRRSSIDNRRNSFEYQYTEDATRIPKSATTNSALRALLLNGLSDLDISAEEEGDRASRDSNEKIPTPVSPMVSQMTPYILRQSKKLAAPAGIALERNDPENTVPEGLNTKQAGVAWTKRKRVAVPMDALPPALSTSQSCPSHLHR